MIKFLEKNAYLTNAYWSINFAWKSYINLVTASEDDSILLSKFFWRDLNVGYYRMIQEFKWMKDM